MQIMEKLVSQSKEVKDWDTKQKIYKVASALIQLALVYIIISQTGHIYYMLTDPC